MNWANFTIEYNHLKIISNKYDSTKIPWNNPQVSWRIYESRKMTRIQMENAAKKNFRYIFWNVKKSNNFSKNKKKSKMWKVPQFIWRHKKRNIYGYDYEISFVNDLQQNWLHGKTFFEHLKRSSFYHTYSSHNCR